MRRRLLDVVVVGGAAALAGTSLQAACGKVVIDGEKGASTGAGGTGAGGTGGAGTSGTGSPGSGGIGGLGGAGGGSCSLTTTGVGGGDIETTECFDAPAGGCPTIYHASMYIIPQGCNFLVSVDCGPIPQGDSCCYLTREQPEPCGARR